MYEDDNELHHPGLWHDGAQTISVRPRMRLAFKEELCRCVPQIKQERVLATPVNGEPEVLAE